MGFFVSNLIAILAMFSTISAFASLHSDQYSLRPDDISDGEEVHTDWSRLECDLSRPLDPWKDGLLSSEDVFSGIEALETMVERHQPLVRIPSVCYDDLGDFDEDERWEPFGKIGPVLEETYPNVYKNAAIETINRFGLVYTVQGSDTNLAPILLTAHQDVVPVDNQTLDQWDYPPFDGFYDRSSGYLYGRGASDDKSAITALMSAMEALLSQDEYDARRTVIFAFGFDHECAGYRGAAEIAKHLEERYGYDGIAVILDEGSVGLQSVGDTLYALPAVYEKGYLDVWFDLDVVGGHSSTPTPHTSIGMMSEIVVALESNPFQPKIEKNSPMHRGLMCMALFSPKASPELTWSLYWGDLTRAAGILARGSRDTQYLIQTSQAVDWIAGGGEHINALPKYVTLGVNHRYAPQDSVGGIQHRITHLVGDVVKKYNLKLEAFDDDEEYENYLSAQGLSRPVSTFHPWKPSYGSLRISTKSKSNITPQSSTKGAVWDTFAGTVRHTYASEARTVVVGPGVITGSTDSRHYLNLSKNIYRWSPGSLKSFGNANSINERLLMSEHIDMARFYYDFIRNFDQADI